MSQAKNIRNFSIIAHIDHGKSTLADRMIEMTDTVEKRRMRDQVLDTMELERERGITIKMQPVSMSYMNQGETYHLNLIDTPGHIDFSYEVSRALKAVEGSILLVDATQGIQAQTMTVLEMAKELDCVIVPAVSKVDSPLAQVEETKKEIAKLIGCSVDDVLETSGKTGAGVDQLLAALVDRVPQPQDPFDSGDTKRFRSLVFDFEYSNHQGVILYVRSWSGLITKGDRLVFKVAGKQFTAGEVGIFTPEKIAVETFEAGEIGYIVTGIKEPGIASVGDTVAFVEDKEDPLPGYMQPKPVVWASLYPESQDDFTLLRQALERLRLTDASLSYEEESSNVLGRGYRCGFLGMLHLEVITERIRREFQLDVIVTMPSITYKVKYRDGKEETVYTPSRFPNDGTAETVWEPWVNLNIIAPNDQLGSLMQILYEHEAVIGNSETFGSDRTKISAAMPLRELMRNFFDRVKSVSRGYASVAYDLDDMKEADVARLDVLVAEEPVPAFTRVVARSRAQEEAEQVVDRLYELLPRQQFAAKIQVAGLGRILSSKTLPALKKDVTGHLYGGDYSRKKKLLEKQKKGKKRMKGQGRVSIPHEVFLKMMRGGDDA